MLSFRKLTAVTVISAAAFLLGVACSSDDDADDGSAASGAATGTGASSTSGGTSSTSGGSSSSGGTTGSGTSGSSGTTSTAGTGGDKIPTITEDGTALCGTEVCQCSNGIDDDMDGDPDGLDVECQGPLDNDEGSFATGIPGDNRDGSWMDCFFDGNSGAGDDGCKYPPECLTGGLDPNSEDCAISQECLDFCGARTPNGCDCFGCCTIQLDSGESIEILTTTGCSIEQIDDENACPRCEKTGFCENTCGECELCPGKTEEDLPETCVSEPDPDSGTDPPDYTCEGAQVCGDSLPCPVSYYCSLGCCIPVVK